MKKKFTRITAVLMCIIIACMSMSVSAFAVTKDVYWADDIEGEPVITAIANESETCIFLELGSDEYAYTTNGKDYTRFNFEKYRPAGYDDFMIYSMTVKGDMFCFLVCANKYEWFTDGYEEWAELVGNKQVIITTTDFKSFNKYDVNFDVELDNYAAFDYIGDEFFYGVTVSREAAGKTYFSGVYYTTKDFVNWTKHQTPELETTDPYPRTYYTVAGDTLCIELYTFNDDDDGVVSSKVFATQDLNNYTVIFKGFNKGETTTPYLYYTPVKDKVIRICDIYTKKNDEYVRTEIVQVDVKTGEEQIILEEELNYWNSYYNTNNFFVLYEKTDGSPAEVLMYNSRSMKYETEKTDYYMENIYFNGYSGDAFFFTNGYSLYVSPSGNPAHYREYDLSACGFEQPFFEIARLKGAVYVYGTIWDYDSDYAYTKVAKFADISLQKNGDLNNDNQVNSTDALAVLMSTVNKKTLTAAEKAVADTTKDGQINSTDALMILQYAVGKRLGI